MMTDTTRINVPSVANRLALALMLTFPLWCLGGLTAFAWATEWGPFGPPAPPLPVLGELPDFTLIERNGEPLAVADLRGRVWIANFIFTSCAGPCPIMSRKMAELQKRLSKTDRVRLVSFSVDPERDTPEVLSEYGQRYGADPRKWLFLTGPRDTIQRVAVQGFKMGNVDDPMMHSTHFAVVDGQGRLRGYFDSNDADVQERVLAAVRVLLREQAG